MFDISPTLFCNAGCSGSETAVPQHHFSFTRLRQELSKSWVELASLVVKVTELAERFVVWCEANSILANRRPSFTDLADLSKVIEAVLRDLDASLVDGNVSCT